MKKDNVIAGLDIGSTKVAVVIAAPSANGLDIIGVGVAPSSGLRKGVVVNIEATTDAIKKAKEEAELMAGCQLEKVWVGVSGGHLKSFDSKGIIAIRNNEVSQSDVERVIDAAKTIAVPVDRQVLHVLPRDFKIDEQDGILQPVGMSGVRLEANVHIVTGSYTAIQNTTKCVERAGLMVEGLVLEPFASSLAVVGEDEKNLGVAVVDIGGGTSDVVIYTNGAVAYTASLPIGGMHVTNDVAVGLRTPHHYAEELKKKYGCALASLIDEAETIEVEGVGGRKERTVPRRYLCEIIEPRAEETLNFIHNELQKSAMGHLIGSGVVLTGGASQLDGLTELGEFVFDMPVRRGLPKLFGGITEAVKSPMFSTALGLLIHANDVHKNKLNSSQMNRLKTSDKLISRLKGFVDGIF